MLVFLVVKRFLILVIFLLSFALSQQHFNHLNINGVLHDEIGPFYFINYGNNKDAYVLAKDFAELLELGYRQDFIANMIYFSSNDKIVSLKATTDIAKGIIKTPDAISIPNKSIDSPMAIIVNDKVYIALSPVLYAFGGDSPYNVDDHTLYSSLKLDNQTPRVGNNTSTASSLATISKPRIGKQENGGTRVVFDLPEGSSYQIKVKDNGIYIVFNKQVLIDFEAINNVDANIMRIQSTTFDGLAAISINPSYFIAENSGYKYALIPAGSSSSLDRLYFDFHRTDGAIVVAGVSTEDNSVDISSVTPELTIIKKVVVIDSGHGGKDPGAVSSYAIESKVVLAIALELRDLLEAQGIEVILTRDNDHFLELAERSEFAKPDINLFISIHANSNNVSSANGIETWVFGEPLDGRMIALANLENGGGEVGKSLTQEALNYAQSIPGKIYKQEQLRYSLELAEIVQKDMVAATGARDRGVKENALWVIRKARTPAILVEVGFITNPIEGVKLTTLAYQEKIAMGLANGVVDFLNKGGLSQ